MYDEQGSCIELFVHFFSRSQDSWIIRLEHIFKDSPQLVVVVVGGGTEFVHVSFFPSEGIDPSIDIRLQSSLARLRGDIN